ncbi:MAG: hypothetical protein Ct9H300mP28_13420 [Pseudomonadota bacterium]|nr:MAG: hypothetical protein Ct9H300mP28_13420 [Pseudomonadota bacterium]
MTVLWHFCHGHTFLARLRKSWFDKFRWFGRAVEDVNTLIEELAVVKPSMFFAVPRVYNRIYEV